MTEYIYTHMGVHPNENTTMNRYMKVIPAFALAGLVPGLLNKPVTMAKIPAMVAVDKSRILRRPKRSTVKDPY